MRQAYGFVCWAEQLLDVLVLDALGLQKGDLLVARLVLDLVVVEEAPRDGELVVGGLAGVVAAGVGGGRGRGRRRLGFGRRRRRAAVRGALPRGDAVVVGVGHCGWAAMCVLRLCIGGRRRGQQLGGLWSGEE